MQRQQFIKLSSLQIQNLGVVIVPAVGLDGSLGGAPPQGMKIISARREFFALGKDALTALTHGANGSTPVAALVVHPARAGIV